MDHLPPLLQLELLGRLVAAVILGGVLGIERQLGQHPAGLRTHILVSLGSAAYTVASTYGVEKYGTVQDAGRIAAQIVAGVGFLGAGTIWRSGSDRIIYGLTTAASIWVAASIGMLAGFGLYVLAGGSAILGFVVLRMLKGLEEAPLKVPVPRLRRRAHRAAESGEPSVTPDVSVDGPAFSLDAQPAGILSPPETPAPRKRGKKTRKRKRRDVELETMPQISDAPHRG